MLRAASAFKHCGSTFRELRLSDEIARLFPPSSKQVLELGTICYLTAFCNNTSNLYIDSRACERTADIDDRLFGGVDDTVNCIAGITVAFVRD
jgi:hypothetical protein